MMILIGLKLLEINFLWLTCLWHILMNTDEVKLCFIRVLHSTEPTAFHGLFLYLEDNFIVKDKSEMWKCISVVAQKAFEMFLSVKAEKVSY